MTGSQLVVFDADGKQLRSIEALGGVSGLSVDSDGRALVLCKDDGHVKVLASDGTLQRIIGSPGRSKGQLTCPRALALHGELLFVVDRCRDRVVVFNKTSGEFVRYIGQPGSDSDGDFQYPDGVAVSAAGEVFVRDFVRDDIQVFTVEGKFLRKCKIGRPVYREDFSNSSGLAIDRAGNLLVSVFDQVRVLTSHGSFITEFAIDDRGQDVCNGPPHVDRDGRIFVPGKARNPRAFLQEQEVSRVHVFAFPV